MSEVLEGLFAGLFVMIAAFVVIALFGALMAVPLMYLWNWLMPDIFGLVEITYLQAWGLYFLSSLLFKSSQASKSD